MSVALESIAVALPSQAERARGRDSASTPRGVAAAAGRRREIGKQDRRPGRRMNVAPPALSEEAGPGPGLRRSSWARMRIALRQQGKRRVPRQHRGKWKTVGCLFWQRGPGRYLYRLRLGTRVRQCQRPAAQRRSGRGVHVLGDRTARTADRSRRKSVAPPALNERAGPGGGPPWIGLRRDRRGESAKPPPGFRMASATAAGE